MSARAFVGEGIEQKTGDPIAAPLIDFVVGLL